MSAPVSLVTIHHQGAGSPNDRPVGPYTYWIGATRWFHMRTVWTSTATLNFNRVSLDVCLSGNRMTQTVSNNDLNLIRAAVGDARARRYVVNNPTVRAHRNSPGSATVCPGNHTMARWTAVADACSSGGPVTPPPITPPRPGGAPVTTVASRVVTNGRPGTAYPVPALNIVVLANGARLQGDRPGGGPLQRIWSNPDRMVQDLRLPLLDIAPTVGSDGRPDGRGIVAIYDRGVNGEHWAYTIPWG